MGGVEGVSSVLRMSSSSSLFTEGASSTTKKKIERCTRQSPLSLTHSFLLSGTEVLRRSAMHVYVSHFNKAHVNMFFLNPCISNVEGSEGLNL